MTSSEPFVDSSTLMAALFHAQRRTQALTDFVCNSEQFAQLEANSMVKEKLVHFLKADLAFREAVAVYQCLPWFRRKNRWSMVRRLSEESLGGLQAKLTEAFNEFEMIRKLALPENSLLMLRPYVFKFPNRNARSRQSSK